MLAFVDELAFGKVLIKQIWMVWRNVEGKTSCVLPMLSGSPHFNSNVVSPFLDWQIPFPPQRLQSHPARGLRLGRLSQTQESFPFSQPWLLVREPPFSPYLRLQVSNCLQLVAVLLDYSVRRHSPKTNGLIARECVWQVAAKGGPPFWTQVDRQDLWSLLSAFIFLLDL